MFRRQFKEVNLNHNLSLQISTWCTCCGSHHWEKTHLGGLQHIALPLSSSHWTQLQDLLLPTLMVPSIDLEKQFWCELNCLSSSERRWSKIETMIVLVKYSERLDAGMLALWCWRPHILGHWWCGSHLITQFRDYFKPPTVVGVNILSDLLEGWCQSLDLRHCLNYVFSLLLRACCEAPEIGNHKSTDEFCSCYYQQESICHRVRKPHVRTFSWNVLKTSNNGGVKFLDTIESVDLFNLSCSAEIFEF